VLCVCNYQSHLDHLLNNEMKQLFKSWQTLLLSLMLVGTMAGLASCGSDDEPKANVIDYYISVEEVFLVNGSTYTSGYENPRLYMKDAIHQAYPTPNEKGDDEAVIAACDQAYHDYVEMYTGYAAHITCMVRLMRRDTKEGSVQELKTYVYNINPSDD